MPTNNSSPSSDSRSSTSHSSVVGVLLAAGQGSRFGGDKLLHPLKNNIPMGLQSAQYLQQAVDEVICVVRPSDHALIQHFQDAGFKTIVNENHETGLSSSIVAGVTARPHAQYWVIALGDMPYIQTESYQQLSQAISDELRLSGSQSIEEEKEKNEIQIEKQINKPNQYQPPILRLRTALDSETKSYKAGHPVAFPQRLHKELLSLEGDKGGAALLKKASHKVHWIDVNDAGIHWDIDTPDKL